MPWKGSGRPGGPSRSQGHRRGVTTVVLTAVRRCAGPPRAAPGWPPIPTVDAGRSRSTSADPDFDALARLKARHGGARRARAPRPHRRGRARRHRGRRRRRRGHPAPARGGRRAWASSTSWCCRAPPSTARGRTTRSRSPRTRRSGPTRASRSPPTRPRSSAWPRSGGTATPARPVAVLRPTVAVAKERDELAGAARCGAARGVRAGDAEPPSQFVHLDDLAAAVDLARRERLRGRVQRGPRRLDQGRRAAGPRRAGPHGPPARAGGRAGSPRGAGRSGSPRRRPGVVAYTAHPWVVANDRLRPAGWEPEHSQRGGLRRQPPAPRAGPPSAPAAARRSPSASPPAASWPSWSACSS